MAGERYWPLPGSWLEAEASNLRFLDNMRSAALDWLSKQRAPAWLVHSGQRLASAESLLVNPLYSRAVPLHCGEYLASCQDHQPVGDAAEFEKRMALVRQELGDDIFKRLEDLVRERNGAKEGSIRISAFTGGIVDDLQVRKNKLLDRPMWHPMSPEHVGNAGAASDYSEVWRFPCCDRTLAQDLEPSQERADGCKPMPS